MFAPINYDMHKASTNKVINNIISNTVITMINIAITILYPSI
jgi:hypothetical protein